MASINQNLRPPVTLPNFCNLGVSLRILLAVNGVSLIAAGLKSSDWNSLWQELMGIAALVQPVLLLSLLLLCAGRRLLERMPYSGGIVLLLLLEELLATLVYFMERELMGEDALFHLYRYWLLPF